MDNTIKLPSIDWLQAVASEVIQETDEKLIEEALCEVWQYYSPLNYPLSYGANLWRGRSCETKEGYSSLSQVHYPPKKDTRLGRVNDKGSPLLYVSFNPMTALSEVRAKPNDFIHMVSYTADPRMPITSVIFGEFSNVHLRGVGNINFDLAVKLNPILNKLDYETGLSFIFLDSFFAQIMSDQSMESKSYVHSRVLARLVFEKYPHIDAIHYPSVARNGAMNLAIKPEVADKVLSFSGTGVFSVDDKFDFGLYRFSEIKHTTNFSSDLTIQW